MSGTRQFLKQETSAAHELLDQIPVVAALAGGHISPHDYFQMLAGYHGFFVPWEKRLREEHAPIVEAVGEFRFHKSSWLTEDLGKSGGAAPLPAGDEFLPPSDLAGLAGCLYVIEGSTLGGFYLSRAKRDFPMKAGRFFQGYGQETMTAWTSFTDWLELTVTSEPDRLRASESAIQTFGRFQRIFQAISPTD